MSSGAGPISTERFAIAIVDLPVGNLHMKAAEIRNSILHLQDSNVQLQPLADEGDRDCSGAIAENQDVIIRMEERIQLLKDEVTRRGLPWPSSAEDKGSSSASNGRVNGRVGNTGSVQDSHSQPGTSNSQTAGSQSEVRSQNEGLIRDGGSRQDGERPDENGLHL